MGLSPKASCPLRTQGAKCRRKEENKRKGTVGSHRLVLTSEFPTALLSAFLCAGPGDPPPTDFLGPLPVGAVRGAPAHADPWVVLIQGQFLWKEMKKWRARGRGHGDEEEKQRSHVRFWAKKRGRMELSWAAMGPQGGQLPSQAPQRKSDKGRGLGRKPGKQIAHSSSALCGLNTLRIKS